MVWLNLKSIIPYKSFIITIQLINSHVQQSQIQIR